MENAAAVVLILALIALTALAIRLLDRQQAARLAASCTGAATARPYGEGREVHGRPGRPAVRRPARGGRS